MDELDLILRQLGIIRKYRGARSLELAIRLALNDEDRLLHICELYRDAAVMTGSNRGAAERAMRRLVRRAWTINYPLMVKIARYPLEEAPCLSDFIEMMVVYIRDREMQRKSIV